MYTTSVIFRFLYTNPVVRFQVCGITEKSLTYNETYRNILRFSDALDRRGYKHGDVVAACLPNCLEMPTTVHACAARGIAATTLNPLYTEGKSDSTRSTLNCSVTLNPLRTEVSRSS